MTLPKGYIMVPCPNCGTNPHKPGYLKAKYEERDKAVIALHRKGMSLRYIGACLGISHEAARLIIERKNKRKKGDGR